MPTLIEGETTVDSHIQKVNMLGGSSANIGDNYRLILSASEELLLCDFFFVQIFSVFPFEICNYILEG